MENNQNWYRELLALVLVSAVRGAVEFLTNPGSRDDAAKQIKGAFAEIDYDQLAKALNQYINEAADTSKERLNQAIDQLRERSVEAVDEAKGRAEKQLGQKRGGRKMRFVIGMLIGAAIAYFLIDEQRRDELLDRLTGASGPIEQAGYGMAQQASTAAQQGANAASSAAQSAAQQTSSAAQQAANTTASTAQQAADATSSAAQQVDKTAQQAKDKTEK